MLEAVEAGVSQDLVLTDSCAKRITKLMEMEDNPNLMLRLTVLGGGCSGFEYNITVGHEYDEEKDTLSHQYGVDVIVDRKSALYLDGTVLDYYNDISQRGFTFSNPNAVKSCGCGSSFQA